MTDKTTFDTVIPDSAKQGVLEMCERKRREAGKALQESNELRALAIVLGALGEGEEKPPIRVLVAIATQGLDPQTEDALGGHFASIAAALSDAATESYSAPSLASMLWPVFDRIVALHEPASDGHDDRVDALTYAYQATSGDKSARVAHLETFESISAASQAPLLKELSDLRVKANEQLKEVDARYNARTAEVEVLTSDLKAMEDLVRRMTDDLATATARAARDREAKRSMVDTMTQQEAGLAMELARSKKLLDVMREDDKTKRMLREGNVALREGWNGAQIRLDELEEKIALLNADLDSAHAKDIPLDSAREKAGLDPLPKDPRAPAQDDDSPKRIHPNAKWAELLSRFGFDVDMHPDPEELAWYAGNPDVTIRFKLREPNAWKKAGELAARLTATLEWLRVPDARNHVFGGVVAWEVDDIAPSYDSAFAWVTAVNLPDVTMTGYPGLGLLSTIASSDTYAETLSRFEKAGR